MVNTRPDIPVTPEELNGLMPFDHMVRVDPGGFVHDHWELHEPSVYQYLNEDGDAPDEDPEIEQRLGDTWDFFSRGYTGQYGVRPSEPVMHNSESIGGRLARDILAVEVPTLFVTVWVTYFPYDEDEESFISEWVVLYKEL